MLESQKTLSRMESNLSTEQAKELADELAALSRRQSEALLTAAYVSMSKGEAQEYDERRLRIGEICGLLTKFSPK